MKFIRDKKHTMFVLHKIKYLEGRYGERGGAQQAGGRTPAPAGVHSATGHTYSI